MDQIQGEKHTHRRSLAGQHRRHVQAGGAVLSDFPAQQGQYRQQRGQQDEPQADAINAQVVIQEGQEHRVFSELEIGGPGIEPGQQEQGHPQLGEAAGQADDPGQTPLFCP